jgi:hypothetical protein
MHNYTRLLSLLALVLLAAPSFAQSVQSPESSRVELSALWWKPDPTITVSSGTLSSDIDFVNDLGVDKDRFREIRVVLKPGLTHKIRFAYIPVRYAEEGTVLSRAVTFRNVTYNVNLPVNAALNWDLYRFGYEWDFVAGRHGFIGVVAEVKYNKLDAQLASPIGVESTQQTVPVPTVGGIARAYLTEYFSVTGEFTGLKLDRTDFRGKFYDLDAYAQINLSRSLAAQVGYRSIDVDYAVDADEGILKLKGIYFGAVARF